MNRREALARALRHAADAIEGEIDNGSGWIGEDDDGELMPEADNARMERAVRQIADEMRARSERLVPRGTP